MWGTRGGTWRFSVAVVCALVLTVIVGSPAAADSYQVTAAVPYPPPTQPAEPPPSLDGSTSTSALTTITGTCEILIPTAVISIWRDGSSIGSGPCTSGAFSIPVMLNPGVNILTIRTVNASGIYGPDSDPVSLTYSKPSSTSTGTPGNTFPTNPQQEKTAANQAADTGLQLRPKDPFSSLSARNRTSLSFSVNGGTVPYLLEINWGDGRSEVHTLTAPGTYTYNTGYDHAGVYTVRVRVSDAAGAYSLFEYVIVGPDTIPQTFGSGTGEDGIGWLDRLPAATPYIVTGAAVAGLVGFAMYIGVRIGEYETFQLVSGRQSAHHSARKAQQIIKNSRYGKRK